VNHLVTSATVHEIEPFIIEAGSDPRDWAEGEVRGCRWRDSSLEFEIFITGVGMTATACHLGHLLATRSCSLAIQLGIAGSFNRAHDVGSVVRVLDERIADLGAEDGEAFLDVFELGLADPDREPWSGGRLEAVEYDLDTLNKIPAVSSISVNCSHGSEASIQSITSKYKPDIENMEGAAFFYACRNAGVPCLQLRAISNRVERRNRDAWDIPLAVRGLNSTASAVMDELAARVGG
jgi:futalosine hydrolase